MFRRFGFIALLTSVFAFNSCETEFSLNGDYELKPIVFGLLNAADTIHYVKITKAYLGDGSNLEYAQIADSSYFDNVDAQVIEYDRFGEATGRQWQLRDSILLTKDQNGIFYAPEQKIYYFEESTLDEDMIYELVADIDEGSLQISGSTSMISGFKVSPNVLFPSYKINFANPTVTDDDDYNQWNFNVTEGLNAAEYNYKYKLHWREYYTDGTWADKEATRNNFNKLQTNSPSSPNVHIPFFSGQAFYEWVGNTIPDDPNVEKRTYQGLDMIIAVAHADLKQYMDVAAPASGIAQQQPEFTNISNGLGLFSSRLIYTIPGLALDGSSIQALCTSSYTITKAFCSELPEHSTESYYCQ